MRALLCCVFLSGFAVVSAVAADAGGVTEKNLTSGDLAGGQKALTAILEADPNDGKARFGLGTVQFVRAVEHLVQGFYKYGLRPDMSGGMIPFARLPVPINPNPRPIGYDDLRTLFEEFIADLGTAEATLALVKDDAVKLPLHFGLVRLDFNGDGKATEDETLWKIYARLNAQVGREKVDGRDAGGFRIAFDRGDVSWLRGYCHLLMALSELYLAYDANILFEHTAHIFYSNPKTPFPFLKHDRKAVNAEDVGTIGDILAFVHLLHFPVKEPAKTAAALKHLEAMIALSRESWKFYRAETDNDDEWIPNPKQKTVVPGAQVTDEIVNGWFSFLDEAEAILAGKMLLPFWRDGEKKGLILRKVFTDPRELDAVLWIQGTAAIPYLEEGPITKPETWTRLWRVFNGEFIGFAIWFN
jgi:hypothetical protein